MLALALLPTLSHALAHSQGSSSRFAEVCTPQGMKQVAIDGVAGEADDAPTQAAGSPEHCAYCAGSAQAAGMPPAPLQVPLLRSAALDRPAPFLKAPRTLVAWCSAQPRAPPAAA